jgi:heterodisulfide reductase subunit C
MSEDSEVVVLDDANLEFAREVAAQPGGENLWRCFACGTCVSGCPVSEVAPEYSPRKIIRQILFGQRDAVLASPEIWYCLVCYRCYARCPQKVNFTDVMRVLRYMAIKGRHVPVEVLKRQGRIDQLANQTRCELLRSAMAKGDAAVDSFETKLEAEIGSVER